MKQYDVVVIGGSAAGATAAVTARRHEPGKSVLLIRKEAQVPIPCGIPYIIGTVGDPQKNLIPVDNMGKANGFDTLADEVTDIDRPAACIRTASGEVIGYDRLVLATGSEPIVPPIPGADLANVFAVWKDVTYLQQMLQQVGCSADITIIGGGFIGVEIAEECRKLCPSATIRIVEMLSHCLQLVYDPEFSVVAEEKLREQNIELLMDERVEAIEGEGHCQGIRLQSGRCIPCGIVILGIGARANNALAKKAGLPIGPTGGVVVDTYMRTEDQRIFACGDCAEKVSFFDGTPTSLKLASIATMEARIAGANLFRMHRTNKGAIGAYSTVLGNTAFAAAGMTETQARSKGIRIAVGASESVNRHPGCMPGAANLKVKLVFDAETSLLVGGQVSGALSGGELINTISACISQRMTADDIATFQIGTHPALTASPIAYQLVNAAEMALVAMRRPPA